MRLNATLWAFALAVIAVAPAPAMASIGATTSVSALDDLYLAGSPAGRNCCAGDSAPAESPVLADLALTAGATLTFTASGGASHSIQPVSPTPDGDTSFIYNLTADYGTGISGPTGVFLNGLAGVFLGPDEPSGPAPAQLMGTSFNSLAPGLDQIFFIGDGLTGTGSGSLQTFIVPAGATRLFLGIIDDGGYYDNHGTIIANVTEAFAPTSAAPEPQSWLLMLSGVGLLGAALRLRKARRAGPIAVN